MKQVLQDARSGEIKVVEVPSPRLLPGCVLVRIAASLVSAGTERASTAFAEKNLLQKAQARPDLVRDVLNKVRRDGVVSTLSSVRSRLDLPSALGYSSAGTVIATADEINDIRPGDRVACAGAGYAVHAQVACIPRLLTTKIPEASVSLEEAAFTTVGTVALHGIRVADIRLGDVVAVIGLGLLGQLTVQLLKAAGCRVVGMDINTARAILAKTLGADAVSTSPAEFRDLCLQYSSGHLADAVLVTAETVSSGPVNLAGEVARDRAIVVAVGTVGMDIQRKTFYEKELDFRISRSYGPGRYDSAYEQKGRDYPIGYVRWTETRNMEAFLRMVADGKLNLQSLITHRFQVEQAPRAYELITGSTGSPFLGVLIKYPDFPEEKLIVESRVAVSKARPESAVRIGLIGAGAFATGTLLPAIKQIQGIDLIGVCAANGSHSEKAAGKFGFQYSTSDEDRVLRDPNVNAVVISTRHNLHARQVMAAIRSRKHVFCEKPLCLTEDELAAIVQCHAQYAMPHGLQLMVGFNRRFSPMMRKMKDFLGQIHEPFALNYRVNAGMLAADHWTNDPEQGGGRIRGEVCHFVDLLTFLAGPPTEVHTRALANPGQYSDDNVLITLQFANGSQGNITYVANGDRAYSKERLEVFGGGVVAVMEDFRTLELVRNGRKQQVSARIRQDKGHSAELQAFANSIREGSSSPIPFAEIVASTLATLGAMDSLHYGQPFTVDAMNFIALHSSSLRLSANP